MTAAAERAIAWRHGYHSAVCSRIEPWEYGTIARAPDVPSYYEYNLARAEGPGPELAAEALAAAAEPALADLEHRRIEVEDEAAGARLAPGFEAMGWVVERLAFLHREMGSRPPTPRLPAPGTAHGAELRVEAFEASRPLRTAWQGESTWGDTPAFVLIEEHVAARRGTRAVVGYLDGAPAGYAGFSAHGDVVEVETVFCLPERRNGGLGAALVTTALETAYAEGARHALIEADDDGDAKRLYERLGFRTVWVRHSFTRKPAA